MNFKYFSSGCSALFTIVVFLSSPTLATYLDDVEWSEIETRRVNIRYATQQGKLVALQHATKVYHDFVGAGSLVIELDSSTSIDELSELEGDNALSIDYDPLWAELGYLDEEASMPPGLRRRTVESVPYGIKLVQADNIE